MFSSYMLFEVAMRCSVGDTHYSLSILREGLVNIGGGSQLAVISTNMQIQTGKVGETQQGE